MDGISPEQITAVEKGINQITFVTGGERKYQLTLQDARNSIYHLSGDENAYLVPLAKASGFRSLLNIARGWGYFR